MVETGHIALGAFVNYVKHAGFPRRGMRQSEGADGVTRSTVIGRFVYKQTTYGPWEPAAVGLLIDDFRSPYMDVLRVAAKLSAEA